MRRELENYYKSNFGSFTNVKAASISHNCLKEYALLDAPGILLFKKVKTKLSKQEILPVKDMRHNIIRNLGYSVN